MDTDQLIRTLAADNAHRARPVGFALMLALLAAAPVSLLMFFTELGVRPDVMIAMRNPFFDLKFAVTLALAIAAIAVSLHLSRPEASLRGFGWLLLVPVGILTAAIGGEMMMPQRLPMMTRLVGKNSWICLTAIPLMSLPLLAGALIGLRHGAPARPAVAGAIAGTVVGGTGGDALRLALHGRFTAVRGDLVHARDRAGDRDRRAGRIEAAEVLGDGALRHRRVLLHAVEAQHLLRGRRPQPLVGVLAGRRDRSAPPPDSSSRMLMIVLTVDHDSPATFARIITPSARVSIIMFSAIATGTLASAAIEALASSNLPASANDATWNSSSRPSSYSDLTSAWAIAVFLGDRRGRRARAPRCLLDRGRHLGRLLRVGGLQPLPHRVGGLGEQFQIEMPRHGRTQADAGREIVVAFGAADQAGEAALGEFRAGIVDGATGSPRRCRAGPARR